MAICKKRSTSDHEVVKGEMPGFMVSEDVICQTSIFSGLAVTHKSAIYDFLGKIHRHNASFCLVACGRRSLNVLILLLPGKLQKGLS
jgi:hypothetical protein